MSLFHPVEQKKIYEKVLDQIQSLISEGTLRPGDRLPSERDLAEQLGASRASIREACRVLEAMGLVENKPGEGKVIREASLNPILASMAINLGQSDGFNFLEVRRALEVEGASLAAERASDQDIENMSALIETIKIHQQDDYGVDADTRFHFAVAGATHNPFFLQVMNTVSDLFTIAVREFRFTLVRVPGNADKLVDQHVRIFEAIKARHPGMARQAMSDHLEFVRQELERSQRA